MGYDLKTLKQMLREYKKAKKMIDRMYCFRFNPLKHPLLERNHVDEQIAWLTEAIKNFKEGE